jgi:hypothetical protein
MTERTFWLSFRDPDQNRNLGVIILDLTAEEIGDEIEAVAAAQKAHNLGINPGGEVLCMEVGHVGYTDSDKNRLLNRDAANRVKEKAFKNNVEELADKIMEVVKDKTNIRMVLTALSWARGCVEEELLECYEEVTAPELPTCVCCGGDDHDEEKKTLQ